MAYLTCLKVDNFKRIESIDLEFSPSGNLVEICGRNSAGKSSTLDAIFATIAGAKASPSEPIRRGKSTAESSVTIGGLLITRRWSTSRGTSLTITDANGENRTSPQTILDRLYNALSFDPLAFLGMESRKQAETLRRLIGLNFSDLDSRREKFYQERAEVNRAIKAQEARYGEMVAYPEVIPVDLSELSTSLRAAIDLKSSHAARRRKLEAAKGTRQTIKDDIASIEKQLTLLREKLSNYDTAIAKAEPEIAALVDPDIDAIGDRMANAETINRRVRANREREALESEIEANRAQSNLLTEEISLVDFEKLARLKAARMPVEGLSVDGDSVVLNEIPLEQVSTSEKIKTCLAISAALNPSLKLILIREGSLFDSDNLKLIAEWAREKDFQILMERVSDAISGTGVIIEDGQAKSTQGAGVASRRKAKGEAPKEVAGEDGGIHGAAPSLPSE